MGSYPETAPRVDTDFADTARLTYRVWFTSTGRFTGTFYRVPTLNEGAEDDGTARTARTAIGLDDDVPTSAQLRGTSVSGDSQSPWGFNIMHGIEPLAFTVDVPTPGWHDLVVYRSDAAILFDRIVLETVDGAAGDGLVGPPESPNDVAGAAPQRAVVAELPREMPALHRVPDVHTTEGATSTLDGMSGAVSVTSDNETAVSASLDGDAVRITGHRAGIAEVAATARDGSVTVATVSVTRAVGAPVGTYQEEAGSIVIDAADALEDTPGARSEASNNGTHTWAQARNGVQAVPPASAGAKANWIATSPAQATALFSAGPTDKVNGSIAPGAPPRLDFTVDVAAGGTYYLFANMSNPNADADSYHVLVDGTWRYHSGKSSPEAGSESWYGSTGTAGAAIALAPGEHTISIAPRESGLVLNQLVLTTDKDPGLAGFQEPSARVE